MPVQMRLVNMENALGKPLTLQTDRDGKFSLTFPPEVRENASTQSTKVVQN